MSVDTYLKRKNLQPYTPVGYQGVKLYLAHTLLRWAEAVHLDAKQSFIWKSFRVEAAHKHGGACRH